MKKIISFITVLTLIFSLTIFSSFASQNVEDYEYFTTVVHFDGTNKETAGDAGSMTFGTNKASFTQKVEWTADTVAIEFPYVTSSDNKTIDFAVYEYNPDYFLFGNGAVVFKTTINLENTNSAVAQYLLWFDEPIAAGTYMIEFSNSNAEDVEQNGVTLFQSDAVEEVEIESYYNGRFNIDYIGDLTTASGGNYMIQHRTLIDGSTVVPETEVPVTEAPATEPPVTEEPATEVPETEAPATPTVAPATEAPTNAPEKPSSTPSVSKSEDSGCGSIIGGNAVLFVALSAIFFIKKNKR